jgi:hypothetical protein
VEDIRRILADRERKMLEEARGMGASKRRALCDQMANITADLDRSSEITGLVESYLTQRPLWWVLANEATILHTIASHVQRLRQINLSVCVSELMSFRPSHSLASSIIDSASGFIESFEESSPYGIQSCEAQTLRITFMENTETAKNDSICCLVNREKKIMLVGVDGEGLQCQQGGWAHLISWAVLAGDADAICVKVGEVGGGVYCVCVTCRVEGAYRLGVSWRGQPISGDPILLRASNTMTLGGSMWGNGRDQLNSPFAVCVGPDCTVYVADSCNHRIQIFDSNGAYVRGFGSQGSGNGQFSYPRGICYTPSGMLIVSDGNNHRLQVLSPVGVFQLSIGTGAAGAASNQFHSPYGVCCTANGDIYVADIGNHRIVIHVCSWVMSVAGIDVIGKNASG